MPIRATVGRLVLIALRNVEAQARLEAKMGARTNLSIKWLNWLLDEKGLAGTKTTWPPVGQEELYEEIVRLRDEEHLTFDAIAERIGRERSSVSQGYERLKEWLRTI